MAIASLVSFSFRTRFWLCGTWTLPRATTIAFDFGGFFGAALAVAADGSWKVRPAGIEPFILPWPLTPQEGAPQKTLSGCT
jgi:hypothetical protein